MINSKNVATASSAIPTSDHDFEKISRLHAKSTGRSATFQVGSQHEPSWQLSVDPFADGFGKKQGHVRCSGGGVFGSLNHSSASIKNMFRNWVSQFN